MSDNIISGTARLPIANGGKDFGAALQALAANHKRNQVLSVLKDPFALAAQTESWIREHFPDDPRAIKLWKESIDDQFMWVGLRIQMFLEELISKGLFRNGQLGISIGRINGTGKVFANFCPFCGEPRVCLQRISPDQFRQEHLFSKKRILQLLKLPLRDCGHVIPIEDSVWQIIQNAILTSDWPKE